MSRPSSPAGRETGLYAFPSALGKLNTALETRNSGKGRAVSRGKKLNQVSVKELLDRVSAATTPQSRKALAFQLTRQETTVLLSAIPNISRDERLTERVISVLLLASPRSFHRKVIPLMKTLLLSRAGLVLARCFLERAERDETRFWRPLARARANDDPRIVIQLVGGAKGWRDHCREQHLPLDSPTGAAQYLAFTYLTCADARLLRKHGEGQIVEALDVVGKPGWPSSINHYFTAIEPSTSPIVADKLLHALGHPNQPGNQQWAGVSESIRRKLAAHFNTRHLNDFFGSSNERAVFWRKYAGMMVRMKGVLDDAAIIMDCGKFCVVEFRDVGNATYFYDSGATSRFMAMSISNASQLKRRTLPGFMFKLSHYKGWQGKFSDELRRIM